MHRQGRVNDRGPGEERFAQMEPKGRIAARSKFGMAGLGENKNAIETTVAEDLKDERVHGTSNGGRTAGSTGRFAGRLPTPLQLLFMLSFLVFFAEVAVMFVLAVFPKMSIIAEAFADATLLTLLVFPLLYLYAFRPLLVHIAERHVAETELRDLHEHLEQLVEKRTRDLRDANDQLLGEMAVRRRIERELLESEEMYREISQQLYALLDANDDISLLIDAERRIKWGNRSASRFLHVEPDGLAGIECTGLLEAANIPCEGGVIEESFRTEKRAEERINTADGRIIDVRTFPVPNEKEGTFDLLVVGTDVTEKLKLQEEAVRSSHLASIGELAAGVAHEINNPTNVIINYAQLLQNRLAPGSGEGDLAARIIGEGDRIAAIVESLLSFARKQSTVKEAVDLSQVLQETILLVGSQFRKEKIKFFMAVPRDLPRVRANPQQLKQVFLNLIHNARYALNKKFPDGHQEKTLEIRGASVEEQGSERVRITFTDHGQGISSGVLDKVLNPFYTTKPPGEGTGLGLSISHGIVQDHGGRLTVESEEGTFTRVTVELPAGVETR